LLSEGIRFETEWAQKWAQSLFLGCFWIAPKRFKLLILFGGRGRNRIISQTYFQQHAGQRMTPKTMQSSRNPINRAQMERIFAVSLPLDSSLQPSVRQRSFSAQPLWCQGSYAKPGDTNILRLTGQGDSMERVCFLSDRAEYGQGKSRTPCAFEIRDASATTSSCSVR